MPRASRLILAGQAHHIVQRGNNRQAIFFEDADRRLFISVLGDALAAQGYYVMACHRYIEANPVRARMVARREDHIWSSHGRNALGKPDALIGEHDCYRALGNSDGERQATYREGFAGGLTREVIDTLRDATQRGWVPGRDSFRRQIEAALGRSVDPPVRGRPRKPREEDAALLPKQADLL